jgi:uncharacterized protein YggE
MTKLLLVCTVLFTTLYAENKKESEYIFTEGYGKVETKPDYVTMEIGVTTIHMEADSALIKTNKIIDTLLSILQTYGIKKDDIETHSAALRREYKDNRDTTTYLGVKSECVLKVKYYDLDNFENLLNVMINNGMNVLQSYEFKHTAEDSLKRIAAQLAFVEANKNAAAIVGKSNRKLGKLLNVSYEKPDDYRIRPDFKIELSRDGWGLDLKKRGSLNIGSQLQNDLKYLRIVIPKLEFENNVYTKFELK